jgi:hypothetical protein
MKKNKKKQWVIFIVFVLVTLDWNIAISCSTTNKNGQCEIFVKNEALFFSISGGCADHFQELFKDTANYVVQYYLKFDYNNDNIEDLIIVVESTSGSLKNEIDAIILEGMPDDTYSFSDYNNIAFEGYQERDISIDTVSLRSFSIKYSTGGRSAKTEEKYQFNYFKNKGGWYLSDFHIHEWSDSENTGGEPLLVNKSIHNLISKNIKFTTFKEGIVHFQLDKK